MAIVVAFLCGLYSPWMLLYFSDFFSLSRTIPQYLETGLSRWYCRVKLFTMIGIGRAITRIPDMAANAPTSRPTEMRKSDRIYRVVQQERVIIILDHRYHYMLTLASSCTWRNITILQLSTRFNKLSPCT